MKRFWKDVTITAERGIALDGRPVRTPGRLALVLPTEALAEAVAEEWRAVEGKIDPRRMPLTGLANTAIERVAPDAATFAAGLATWGESDLLCYRAESPDALVARQAAAWNPLLAWARARYDVHFTVTAGIMHQPQPPATLTRLAEAVAARSAFELAALSPIITITGTLVGALALIEDATDAATLWTAAHIDEDWQAELWGRDPLALAAYEERQRDYNAALRFLTLLK
jgi:chaperone required for assembly of F1-ATPase